MNFSSWLCSIALATVYISVFLEQAKAQKCPYFMGNRTTMVHLFEWTWPAIEQECREFLGPRGYGGVQISPPNECHIVPNRPWWERYQPLSYLLTSRSGTEAELKQMIETCNRAGVRVYVDAVINHMTASKTGETHGTGGSVAFYEMAHYPAVPYGRDDFNPACPINDYNNPTTVRNCQLHSLLDLNQSRPHVQQIIAGYMNKLIDMGVAGFRIDAAKHMWPEDLNAIYRKLKNLKEDFDFPKAARPYIFQEVIDLGFESIKKTEYNHIAAVTEFKHSTEIGRAFRGLNDLKWLRNWGPEWGFLPSKDAIVFVDNHDNQRGHGAGGQEVLTYKNGEIYKMAIVFMLAHPYGEVSRVMSSYAFNSSEQGPPSKEEKITSPIFSTDGLCNPDSIGWVCEHRWPEVVNMVEFRNLVTPFPIENWWDNGKNRIAFGRGCQGFIAFNMDMGQEMNVTLQTGLGKGVYCDILRGKWNKLKKICSGNKFNVEKDGKIHIKLPIGPSAMAIVAGSKF